MGDFVALSAWFPDRPPTWREIALGILVALMVAVQFVPPSTTQWPTLLLSCVVTIVAMGPVANTSLGTRFGEWFRGIGKRGRGTLIVLYAIIVFGLIGLEIVPVPLFVDVGTGILLGNLLYITAHIVYAGDVSGWNTQQER